MKQGLFLIFAFCAISNAYAQMDCESIPSCEELGYTQASCPEGSASLKCPFDETKFYCIGGKKLSDAPAPVITPEDWTAECADTIAHCTTLDSNCRCTACESGYLVTNGNCVAECAKSVAVCAKESKIFKADTCTCEACPTNYLFVDGECKKMCTIVAHCKTYDSDYDPCTCTACEDGFTLDNGQCLSPCAIKCKTPYPLFAGEDNTKLTLGQLGEEAAVVYAISQFYVGDKNGDFGQGKWYLPSFGEWVSAWGKPTITSYSIYFTEANEYNKTLINNALTTLAGKGVETETLTRPFFSSSDAPTDKMLNIYYWAYPNALTNKRDDIIIYANNYYLLNSLNVWQIGRYLYTRPRDDGNVSSVRCTLIARNVFNGIGTAPQIGDVMYLDKTYGSASDYDGNKTPVGIIAAVPDEKQDVMIINLKNLRFLSNKIDPDNPYNSKGIDGSSWFKDDKTSPYLNLAAIPDYSESEMGALLKTADNCPCQFYKPACTQSVASCALENKIFNTETCTCEACPSGYLADSDVNECREMCKVKCKNAYPLFTGQEYTKAVIDHYGNSKALIAYAAKQFYAGSKTGNFGQGKWYVPSIGEWMQFYGTDTTQILKKTDDYSATGANGENKELINTALSTLADKGVEAKILEGTYWSSSPRTSTSLWTIKAETGYRASSSGTNTANLRCSSLVTAASAGSTAPQIGDVMYEDKTYGSAADYNGNKTPVGIIASVSDDKKSVTIINLKDLTFNSDYEAKNFDPDNPYGNSKQNTQWLAGTWPIETDNFNEFHQIDSTKFMLFAQASDNCPCQFYIDDIAGTSCTGIYQCKDSYGNCVTCYATCMDYDYYSRDEDNVSCEDTSADRFFSIKIGSGKGSTASSARCCY